MAGLSPAIQHPASAAVGSPFGKADVPVLVRRLEEAGIPVETSPRRLAEYSYDASNYRVPPLAVLYPRSVADVVTALEACRETSTPVVPRGGGTSMAATLSAPASSSTFPGAWPAPLPSMSKQEWLTSSLAWSCPCC